MKLTFTDRLILNNLTPKEGDTQFLLCARDAQNKLNITQEYLKTIDYLETPATATTPAKTSWNDKKAPEIEVDFSDAEKLIYSEVFQKLDDTKKMQSEILDTRMKFK